MIIGEEGGAILAWAVRAAARLVAQAPHGAPEASIPAVQRWARGADVIALFLWSSPRVRRDPSARVSSRELHAHYLEWARAADEPLLTLLALVRPLERAGAARRTSTGRRRLLAGLALD